MPLLEIPVPNLLGGVSQQPAANRQPGQVESCDNALLHVVNGAGKRKGTRHLARLFTGLESVRAVHWIDRDTVERYAVLLGERRVRVFDADSGTEFPVFVNGTATHAGRGETGSGTPINYLDPRVPGGEADQDEDFVIGAGDWLSDAANSITSYIAGRGPFQFGRRQSTTAVTADTVAQVGNSAAALVSDIQQTLGTFAEDNLASVYVKQALAFPCNDVELTFHLPGAPDTVLGARFDISVGGVVTVGALIQTNGEVTAEVEDAGNGWYRCSVRVPASVGVPPPGSVAVLGARELWIRFHTNAATPANKRVYLFGARAYSGVELSKPVPDYVYPQPDLFRELTVADATFLLNTETTVGATTGSTSSGGNRRAFVVVRVGGITAAQGGSYTITLRGTTDHVYTVAPGSIALAQTDAIAAAFVVLINAAGFFAGAAQTTANGSVIRISDGAENLTGVSVADSRGDTMMFGFYSPNGTVTNFADLPIQLGVSSALVRIEGVPERGADDYFATFDLDPHSASGAAGGVWSEGAAPGIPNTLAASTMPQLLTRRQDNAAGTITGVPNSIYFDVSATDWDDRLVGDTTSNPEPSFVGEKIREVFLHRGRLGFLSADNVILSAAGEVFNFWRTTVLSLLDTDPIDLNSGTREVALFRNAAATSDRLLLFTERHQFELLGDPTLTPATASLAVTRGFESLTQARPTTSGRGVIFARSDLAFSSLMEARQLGQDVEFRFDDLTAAAPRYVVGAVVEIVHSSLTGLTVVRAADPDVLYVHQTFEDDQENRLQSAPHRWTFAPDTLIRGMGFYAAELRLVVERAQGWFLESVLTDSAIVEGGRPITHLDRRLVPVAGTVTYVGGTDTTTITLPFTVDPAAEMVVVDAESGLIVPVVASTTTTLDVHGDLSTTDLFVGEAFDMRLGLTEAVLQIPGQRGTLVAMTGRPIDVHRLYLYLASTAFLAVEVTPDLRAVSREEFSAAGLGTGLLLEGVLSVYTGDADFAILGQSTELTVEVVNDTPFPAYIQSGRWEILTSRRAQIA